MYDIYCSVVPCRFCGYIVDSGDNQFHFYGFYCTPNTDRLCLALHSACQARYQRVLDAHMDGEIKDGDLPMPVRKHALSFFMFIWHVHVQYSVGWLGGLSASLLSHRHHILSWKILPLECKDKISIVVKSAWQLEKEEGT